jgi:hypothetical protein
MLARMEGNLYRTSLPNFMIFVSGGNVVSFTVIVLRNAVSGNMATTINLGTDQAYYDYIVCW